MGIGIPLTTSLENLGSKTPYLHSGGHPPGGEPVQAERWHWNGKERATIVRETAAEQSVFLEMDLEGSSRFLRSWLEWLVAADVKRSHHVARVVERGQAAEIIANLISSGIFCSGYRSPPCAPVRTLVGSPGAVPLD
jgi:hypothetical protein